MSELKWNKKKKRKRKNNKKVFFEEKKNEYSDFKNAYEVKSERINIKMIKKNPLPLNIPKKLTIFEKAKKGEKILKNFPHFN
jgi:hypothetical protein